MNRQSKINVKMGWPIVALAALFIITVQVRATFSNKNTILNSLTGIADTVPVNKKLPLRGNRKPVVTVTKPAKDTVKLSIEDSVAKVKADSSYRIDTLTISRDSLDAPVTYKASDSGVLIIPTKEFILYGKANVSNKDMTLDAATISYDQTTQLVKAFGATDTTGNPYSKPNLTQGDLKTISDTIVFNMKTFKGLTKNTYVQQGEIYINAQVMKKISPTEYYAYKGRFTTCNLDTPHFAIRARRMKMISNKLAVSGPASPEIEGVPLPIGIPFGIYPLIQGRHSGILPPAYTVSEDYGLGLEGLGYYKVFNEYIDVVVRTNLYSYGGWSLNVSPKYQKRYRYTGGMNIAVQNTKALNRNYYGALTKEEFTGTKSYSINWQHTQDQRVRPGTSFSANVNFASSKYNQSVLNNPYLNYQNQLSSSISYSKDYRGKANLSVNANHNQNNNTRLVNLSLPTVSANVVTFYPFQKKESVGTGKWYEKFGLGYSGIFNNQVSFYDTAGFSIKKLFDTAQWGATHSIPITLSVPSLGPITLSPSVSYEERWYGQQIFRSWDTSKLKVDTLIKKGFYTARQISFGASASTRIFGTYQFKKSKNIVAIRHEVRPSIGFSYHPDLASKDFYETQVDTARHFIHVSKYEGVIPGAYSDGNYGGLSFGIDNLLEMKVRDKKDTTKANATKKIKLIDGFGFNSSYNLLADSFALAPIQVYARTTLFDKINITTGFTMDPYQVDNLGFRKNKYTWNSENFSLGRITSGNVAISTQFKSKAKDPKKDAERMPDDPYMTPDEQQRQLQYARSNPAEFTDFNIPWSVSLSYSLSFSKQLGSDYKFTTQTYSSLNFQGDFSLTDKWKIGGNGYYDANEGRIQQFSMFITREMHCWQMAINVNPIGLYRSFNITISPKSGILRDLKINRTRTFSNY